MRTHIVGCACIAALVGCLDEQTTGTLNCAPTDNCGAVIANVNGLNAGSGSPASGLGGQPRGDGTIIVTGPGGTTVVAGVPTPGGGVVAGSGDMLDGAGGTQVITVPGGSIVGGPAGLDGGVVIGLGTTGAGGVGGSAAVGGSAGGVGGSAAGGTFPSFDAGYPL